MLSCRCGFATRIEVSGWLDVVSKGGTSRVDIPRSVLVQHVWLCKSCSDPWERAWGVVKISFLPPDSTLSLVEIFRFRQESLWKQLDGILRKFPYYSITIWEYKADLRLHSYNIPSTPCNFGWLIKCAQSFYFWLVAYPFLKICNAMHFLWPASLTTTT